jgi:uncharacterized membrane protein (UPF0127 family)
MQRTVGVLSLVLAAGPAMADGCVPDRVDVRGAGSESIFVVDVAADREKRNFGLMGVTTMAADHGMLFVYDHPQAVAYWMEGVQIPLDMIFLDAGGTVRKVKADARPMDMTVVSGAPDTQYVLEINGGLAAKLGIAVGSELRSPSIDQSRAVWRCD